MKNLSIKNLKARFLILATAMLWSLSVTTAAQTSVFTYQGRFTDAAVAQPTNGTYNMQFAMFDAASNGNQTGATVTIPAVQVVNGIFTVSLDYTAASFDGSPRFLQVTVENTILSPRQEITSAPFAIRARSTALADDSNKLGGINADQYVTGGVVRSVNNLTNNVTLAAGSNVTITPSGNTLTISATGGGTSGNSGINNQTSVQAAANFNIDGAGAANVFNSQTNYRIGGAAVFSIPNETSVAAGRSSHHTTLAPNSTFFGYNTGAALTLFGQAGTFVGSEAGANNSTGANNSFVGKHAGIFNTTGSSNSFFGSDAGKFSAASENSYFGAESGMLGLGGTSNSFFGFQSGRANLSGSNNSFFGYHAGKATTGGGNTFVGSKAGVTTTTGSNNTYLGFNSGSGNGNSNTVVGANAGGTGDFNTLIGVGVNSVGNNNTVIGTGASVQKFNAASPAPNNATAIGAGAVARFSDDIVIGTSNNLVQVPGDLKIEGTTFAPDIKASAVTINGGFLKLTVIPFATNTGNQQLCLNGNNLVSKCPGDAFANNKSDSGQNAQIEMQAAQIKEQNAQIVRQAEQIKIQQTNLEALKQTVCEMNPAAQLCSKK